MFSVFNLLSQEGEKIFFPIVVRYIPLPQVMMCILLISVCNAACERVFSVVRKNCFEKDPNPYLFRKCKQATYQSVKQ